jgi:exosome complex component RRP46
MEGGSRADGRNPNQLRPFSCTGNPLHRAHGSARWAQGDTVVLAAVYGPKPGTRKGENPEKASIEVVWKPKTGQIGTVPRSCSRIHFAQRLRVHWRRSRGCLVRACNVACPRATAWSLKWRVVFAGRQEREYEMTLKRTLQSICLLTVHPNTTTSVVLQVMSPGWQLPCYS